MLAEVVAIKGQCFEGRCCHEPLSDDRFKIWLLFFNLLKLTHNIFVH